MGSLLQRLRYFLHRRQAEADLTEEMETHRVMLQDQLERAGMPAHDATSASRRAIGNITLAREDSRDVWIWRWLDTIWRDIAYALRGFRRAPGFTVAAVLTLALGIGANAAIFSVVEAALLRALPFPDPDRIIAIRSTRVSAGPGDFGVVSPADFRDWAEQSTTFEHMAAFSGNGMTLREDGRGVNVFSARVTSGFFDVLGVRPMLGRTFGSDEWSVSGPRAVVLSHRLWLRQFGGDPSTVGKRLSTGETVIGVMPAGFKFPSGAELWVPIYRDTPERDRRSTRYLRAIGRLRAGQSLEAARAEMTSIGGRLAADYPTDDRGWSVQLSQLGDSLVGDFRPALLTLMGAVGFVLLIACANVSGLILARSTARLREVTVRLALGARRSRLILQFVVEGLLLSMLGAAAGLMLARWSIGALFGLLPNTSWTALASLREDVHLNGPVLLFTAMVSILTGVVFALIPALSAVRLTIAGSLRTAGVRTGTRGGNRFHKSLVVLEFACTLVLLAGAGLFIHSFIRMQRVEYGYDPRGLAIMPLPQPAQNRQVFAEQVIERIKATPGVDSVALMSFTSFGALNFPFNIESRPLPAGDVPGRYSSVGADYFRVLRARLIAGREFDERDSLNAPGVAIINETLARQYFQGENPIGQKIVVAYLNQRVKREIVGVVSDIRQDQPKEAVKPEVFVHWPQLPWLGASLVIRAHRDPASLGKAVQESLWSVDKTLPLSTLRTVEDVLGDQVAEPRLYLILLSAFAASAVFLASIGIYGLLSCIVKSRTHEMAIRIAVGASASDVVRSVIGEGIRLSVAGIALGLGGTAALTGLMKNLLFGVTPTDTLTLSSVTLLLFVVALAAVYIPARRATRVDPLIALRAE